MWAASSTFETYRLRAQIGPLCGPKGKGRRRKRRRLLLPSSRTHQAVLWERLQLPAPSSFELDHPAPAEGGDPGGRHRQVFATRSCGSSCCSEVTTNLCADADRTQCGLMAGGTAGACAFRPSLVPSFPYLRARPQEEVIILYAASIGSAAPKWTMPACSCPQCGGLQCGAPGMGWPGLSSSSAGQPGPPVPDPAPAAGCGGRGAGDGPVRGRVAGVTAAVTGAQHKDDPADDSPTLDKVRANEAKGARRRQRAYGALEITFDVVQQICNW